MTDAVDLFAGAGGAAVGMALLGLSEIGLEWSEDECRSRAAAGLAVVRTDVAAYPLERFAGIEGLWASPPCQDWSAAGKRAGLGGLSGYLVNEVPRWVEALRPRWIACEQVPAVERVWLEHAHAYEALGYHTWVGLLRSEEYGVPQTRTRAILMAHRDHPVGPPSPTHQRYRPGHPAEGVVTFSGVVRPWVSMAEALGWGTAERPFTTFAPGTEAGGMDPAGGTGARATHHREQNRGAWSINTGRGWKPGWTRRTAQVWEGDEPSPTLHFGHDATAWVWRRPATTVAGDPRVTAPFHHYDGEQGRAPTDGADVANGADPGRGPIKLTVPEALVLQSMPPNYPLVGTRTSQFRQTGNLVPPFLACAVVGELLGLDWRAAIDSILCGR